MTQTYADDRPIAAARLEVRDAGAVLRHGDECDRYGARDVWVFEDAGRYFMHYDAAGETGWLCALATSDDGIAWTKHGAVLELGAPGSSDSASASYGVTYRDGTDWHMFYLGTPNVMMPGRVPAFPYQTHKARSSSPTGPWQKQPEVFPLQTRADSFYSVTASPGAVLDHGGEYLQFFSAATIINDGSTKRTLGLARTADLNAKWTIDSEPILPLEEQIENSSLYFEASSQTWFLFTNHIGIRNNTLEEYTDAIWVYWSRDPTRWNASDKAVVLDEDNCHWSAIIGLPSVVRIGDRLAIYYDGYTGKGFWHMGRDIGLAWLELPLKSPLGS